MPLTLTEPPGFADLQNSSLLHDTPALGIYLAKISQNAAFGMVRPEVFAGLYKHGETVIIPTSAVDGYQYSLSECTFVWGIQSTLNQTSGWITGPDSLWYAAWDVDQATGNVECIEYYRRSGDNDQAAQSNDGLLQVWTICQRLKTSLTVTDPITAYTDVADAGLVTDGPLTQAIIQGLNTNSKFSAINSEVIYMGEFVNGNTVPVAVSPADGYAYTRSQMKLQHSWRWTTLNSTFTQPDRNLGQLGPIRASIDQSTGVVSVSVDYVVDEISTQNTHGRIAVFAFCSRNDLIDTIPSTANAFAEIPDATFFPGETLRATTTLQLNKNIREAAVSSEFFGPTDYVNGNTIAAPTSPVDGYVYNLATECQIIWNWKDTSPETGTNLRTPGFYAYVAVTGSVGLTTWRLPPGGPYETTHTFCTITAVIVATRGATHAAVTVPSANPAGDITSTTTDTGSTGDGFSPVAVDEPYQISYTALNVPTTASAVLLPHTIGGLIVTGVRFPAGLSGSYVKCLVAPTADYVITIKQAGTTVGTATIPAAATTGTFSFADDATTIPGEDWQLVGPATPDATLAGLYITLAGIRTATGSTTEPGVVPHGGSGYDDMLDWCLNSDRANSHLTGTHPFYTYAAGNKLWWIKGPAGHPWDIELVDSSYIYHWITENGDEGPSGPGSSWLNASAFKRYGANGKGYPTPQGVPLCPRFFNTSGSAVTIDTPSPNNSHRTLSCETDGEPLINIGAVKTVTHPPTSFAHGGDIGTQPTIIIEYFYGNTPASFHSRERYYLVKGKGQVRWDVSDGVYATNTYTVSQTSTFNMRALGGSPVPYFPCSSSVSWWI